MFSKFKIDQKVSNAINEGKPLVALESTLISHGLPYPENIKVANDSIKAVEESGSVAATIGIINGEIIIGLNDEEINILATSTNIDKVSLHNISLSIYEKKHAATTVATTISIASKVGINFFTTGGIGGVHLGAEKNSDATADLTQLSRNKMFVISSGAKSILDIEKTFEKLETFGIPRIAYNSDFMPGFWYEETNFKVDKNVISINDIANYLKILEDYEHQSSVLIFNKVPKEKAIDKNIIQNWIDLSIDKAKQLNVTGKDVTPFLISEINSLSKNKSLEANSALIINNALLAGKIAKKFSLV